VGLGLPGLKPGCSLSVVREAVAQNDNLLTEQQMLRDKIQATDWEATNEAIEEQVIGLKYEKSLVEYCMLLFCRYSLTDTGSF
jgi:OTU domain-containing protein 5